MLGCPAGRLRDHAQDNCFQEARQKGKWEHEEMGKKDAILNRIACSVVGQLPENQTDAYAVLDLARKLLSVDVEEDEKPCATCGVKRSAPRLVKQPLKGPPLSPDAIPFRLQKTSSQKKPSNDL